MPKSGTAEVGYSIEHKSPRAITSSSSMAFMSQLDCMWRLLPGMISQPAQSVSVSDMVS